MQSQMDAISITETCHHQRLKLKISKTQTNDSEENEVAVRKISQSPPPPRIPLQVPYCQDPRLMRVRRLQSELKSRGIDHTGGRAVLVARLLLAVVNEGLESIPDPLLMDDRQPEKWMLIANQCSLQAEEEEPNGTTRVAVMQRVNKVLEEIKTSREDLMAVATGMRRIQSYDPSMPQCPLYSTIARFASALMIAPVIEAELCSANSDKLLDAHRVISSSRTIFSMRTGFLGIPRHLSVEFATARERQAHERRTELFSSKRQLNPDDATVLLLHKLADDENDILLGEEILLDVGQSKTVALRVVRVEHTLKEEDGCLTQWVIAKPVCAQYAGEHIEYKLSVSEFREARKLFMDEAVSEMRLLR
jgi:hypothetical protein